MQEKIDFLQLTMRRHPDPATVYKQEVVYPDLQVRGAWKKVNVKSSVKPPARDGFSSWVWSRRMYVLGGNGFNVQNDDMWQVVTHACEFSGVLILLHFKVP